MQDASAAAAAFGVTAPTRYSDDRGYRLLANELRFSGAAGTRLSWLAGLAQLRADTRVAGRLEPAPAAGATVLDLRPLTNELAAFGEADLALSTHWRLTTGLRLTRAQERDRLRGAEESGEEDDDEQRNSTVDSATPSLSLDWHSTDRRRIAYLRFARAVRPGGLNPESDDDDDQRRFRADDLSSLDVGVRVAGDALTLQAAAFATRWRDVQSDYLQADGLIGTRNVGNASNVGVEVQLRFSAAGGWRTELGAVLQSARLDDPVVPAAGEDARLPVVPDTRLYALLAREFSIGGWQARLQLRGDHSGASRLSFDADLDRDTPATFLLGAGAGLTRGPWELQLSATNLLDSRADTFAFGNPFSIRDGPQRTPRRPRTLTLQLARSW
jgi:hypothetical protein